MATSALSAQTTSPYPGRTAWVEIDIARLRKNLRLIFEDKNDSLRVLSVVKDNAYGHGAVTVAR